MQRHFVGKLAEPSHPLQPSLFFHGSFPIKAAAVRAYDRALRAEMVRLTCFAENPRARADATAGLFHTVQHFALAHAGSARASPRARAAAAGGAEPTPTEEGAARLVAVTTIIAALRTHGALPTLVWTASVTAAQHLFQGMLKARHRASRAAFLSANDGLSNALRAGLAILTVDAPPWYVREVCARCAASTLDVVLVAGDCDALAQLPSPRSLRRSSVIILAGASATSSARSVLHFFCLLFHFISFVCSYILLFAHLFFFIRDKLGAARRRRCEGVPDGDALRIAGEPRRPWALRIRDFARRRATRLQPRRARGHGAAPAVQRRPSLACLRRASGGASRRRALPDRAADRSADAILR
jgi:hypothetical protein